jgi:hypothetical protein
MKEDKTLAHIAEIMQMQGNPEVVFVKTKLNAIHILCRLSCSSEAEIEEDSDGGIQIYFSNLEEDVSANAEKIPFVRILIYADFAMVTVQRIEGECYMYSPVPVITVAPLVNQYVEELYY